MKFGLGFCKVVSWEHEIPSWRPISMKTLSDKPAVDVSCYMSKTYLCVYRMPLPNSDDYRRLDPKTYDGEFFQEEGLPGRFTINLPSYEDMVLDDEEDEVPGMKEDTAQDEVEEVQNQLDLNLLERLHQGLDAEDSVGPALGFVEDWWNQNDSDEETCGPTVVPNDLDTCYLSL
jgi:hypothetical protein